MMRSIAVSSVWILQQLAFSPAARATAPVQKLECASQKPDFGDRMDVSCPVTASGAAQPLRFRVEFTGGHDDTKASMTAMLDDQPLTCDAGSKLQLMGEEGEVSLECRFTLQQPAGTRHLLKVAIVWTHAQYSDFVFAAGG